MDKAAILLAAKDAITRARATQQAVASLVLSEDEPNESIVTKITDVAATSLYHDPKILTALNEIAEPLANSYLQIIADFEDEARLSWAGTAHEIRELLRKILEQLAPTIQVEAQKWYKLELNSSGPTQKQRVRYILTNQKGDSKQQKVAQDIELIEDKIGTLVRDVYGRASDAAHRSKSKGEAFKILRYFEAFAYDLLNIS